MRAHVEELRAALRAVAEADATRSGCALSEMLEIREYEGWAS